MVRSSPARRQTSLNVALADAYSATGGDWARGPERVYARLAAAMVACSPVPLAGRSIVDVGAGTGVAARAARVAGAERVVEVDAAPGMLRHAPELRSARVAADAVDLPFPDGAFGGAIAGFSMNHLRRPAAGLREMARVARPGSPIVAATYAADDSHVVKAAAEAALAAAGWTPPDWYHVLRTEITPLLATEERCRDAATEAGLAETARIERLEVAFPELGPSDLVEWRLGMAQHAPFVASLSSDGRSRLVTDVLDRLGQAPPVLVRSVLVISAIRT